MAATISKVVASNGTRRKFTKIKKLMILWSVRFLLALVTFTAGVTTGWLYQQPFNISFHFQAGGVK